MGERPPGAGLVPLRLFLGGTFLFAGAQKLADSAFLADTHPQSIAAQMVRFSDYSPLRPLLRFLVTAHLARGAGIGIALTEIAVGLAVLAGFRIRIAAAGGVALSLLFFLTVSWRTRPYYVGSDLAFAAAFTPLLLLGDGGVCSLDAWRRRTATAAAAGRAVDRRAVVGLAAFGVFVAGIASLFGRRPRLPAPRPVAGGPSAPPAGTVPTPTPVPAAQGPGQAHRPSPSAAPPTSASPTRSPRSRAGGTPSSPPPSQPGRPTPSPTPSGTDIGRADDVPVGGALAFTLSGSPGYCYRPAQDRFVAYSRICTHQGCRVDFAPADDGIAGIGARPAEYACPCHGAMFDAETGQVAPDSDQQGIKPLPAIAVRREADGHLYAG